MWVFFLCFLALGLLVALLLWTREKGRLYPPGPWGLPLIGHLNLLKHPQPTLMQWKKKFGPISSCRFGSYPTVVLNDAKLIKQAYSLPAVSGRGDLHVFLQSTRKQGILFSEGRHSLEHRQFGLKMFKHFGLYKKSMESKILEDLVEVLDTLAGSAGKPTSVAGIFCPSLMKTLWMILLTETLPQQKMDHLAKIIQEKGNKMGGPLNQLAFFMPWLDRFSNWISDGKTSLCKDRVDAFNEVYAFMREQLENRRNGGHWVKGHPKNVMEAYFDMEEITTDPESCFYNKLSQAAYFAGDIFIAGIEVVDTTLEWLLYCVAQNPQIQEDLQTEIDSVLGHHRHGHRLPSTNDRGQMPYADAIMYEILRFAPSLPLPLQHGILSEVTLCNYKIPKGTLIFANFYAINHDSEIWGDAEVFRPDRWLGSEGKRLKNDYFLGFSTGKRSCLGEMIARDQLFLYITGIFQRFSVSFKDGPVPVVEPVPGIVFSPSHFDIVFHLRE